MKKSRRKNTKISDKSEKIVDKVSDLSESLGMEICLSKTKFQNNLKSHVKKLSELTGFEEEVIMEAALLKALNKAIEQPATEGDERVGEPKLVREVLPEVVGGEELAPVMSLVDDLELGLREPEEEGREYGAE